MDRLVHFLCSHSLHASEEKREKKVTLWASSAYSSSLSESLCFDCGHSVPPNKPNTFASQVVTKNILTVAIKLNKLTKLCKQTHSVCFHFKACGSTFPRINNKPGHVQALCRFASYPKQFYTSWFNFKATQVQQKHGPTSTGNWRTYKQLGYIFCNILIFQVKRYIPVKIYNNVCWPVTTNSVMTVTRRLILLILDNITK